jgi:zinc protease
MANKHGLHSMPNSETITRAELPNGITVLAYENPDTKSVVLSGGLDCGGAMNERREHNGLAVMTAGALMRGTQNHDFQSLAASLEDVGADFGVSAGVHGVSFGGKALGEDLGLLVDVMAEVLRRPTFPTDHVELLRREVLTWLKYGLQDTRRQAGRAFREALYDSSHPYHHSPRGTLESIPRLSAAMMQEFHAQQYGPKGMTIVAVGNLRAAEVVELIQAKLGDWENPNQPTWLPVPSAPNAVAVRRAFVPIAGKSQSDIVMGVVGPSRKSDDFQAARLANSILGEFGMMGRVGENVRVKGGMAYYAYSKLEGGHGPGAWVVSAGVNPINIDRAIELSVKEVRRMTEELVTDEEMMDNKSYFTGRLPLQLESNEGVAGTILSMMEYDLGLDYLIEMPDIIQRLTREDLIEAVRHYWQSDAYVVSVSGPQV